MKNSSAGNHKEGTKPEKKRNLLIILAAFALAATLLGFIVRAATMSIAEEAESGELTGPATITDDQSASGSKAIQFNAESTPAATTVTFTDSGYEPSTVTIKAGDTLTFKNDSTQGMWPASNEHPTHTEYPGFDALKAYEPGAEWSFKFDNPGTWGWHDHLQPGVVGTTGTVVVE